MTVVAFPVDSAKDDQVADLVGAESAHHHHHHAGTGYGWGPGG